MGTGRKIRTLRNPGVVALIQPLVNKPFQRRVKMTRSSMAPAQDPLAIAAQTLLQAPYVEFGAIYIKLSYWMDNWHGDIERIER